MGMLLNRHYEARNASAAARRDALLAEVEAARAQQAESAIKRVLATQEADDVPCAACLALLGVRPCSVECYVKAGYQAEDYEAAIAKIEADLVAAEAEAKAEAAATAAKVEADELAAKAAAQAATEADAKAEAEAKAKAESDAAKAAEDAAKAKQAEEHAALLRNAELLKAEESAKAAKAAAEAAELAALEEATRPDASKRSKK